MDYTLLGCLVALGGERDFLLRKMSAKLKNLPEETIDDIIQNDDCTLIKISAAPREYHIMEVVKLRDDCYVRIEDIEAVKKDSWDYYALPYNK